MGSAGLAQPAPAPAPAPAPPMQYAPGLNLETAKKAAAAAAAEIKKNNWQMAIAVVTNGGHLIYFEKIDGTQFASIKIAEHKAIAAATFRRPTKVFGGGGGGGGGGGPGSGGVGGGGGGRGGGARRGPGGHRREGGEGGGRGRQDGVGGAGGGRAPKKEGQRGGRARRAGPGGGGGARPRPPPRPPPQAVLRPSRARVRPPPCLALRSMPGRSTRSPTAISTWCATPSGWPTGWCSRSACIPARRRCFPPRSASRCWRKPAGRSRKEAGCELACTTFADLVVAAARRAGATLLIRGLRDGTDLDYEMQMAGMNGAMAPEIQTVFLPASPVVRPITATLVRQIAGMGGDVTAFVPAPVAQRLRTQVRRLTVTAPDPKRSFHDPRSCSDCRTRLRRTGARRPAEASRRGRSGKHHPDHHPGPHRDQAAHRSRAQARRADQAAGAREVTTTTCRSTA